MRSARCTELSIAEIIEVRFGESALIKGALGLLNWISILNSGTASLDLLFSHMCAKMHPAFVSPFCNFMDQRLLRALIESRILGAIIQLAQVLIPYGLTSRYSTYVIIRMMKLVANHKEVRSNENLLIMVAVHST